MKTELFFFSHILLLSFRVISTNKISSLFADVQQRYLRDLITIYEQHRLIYNRVNR